MFITDNFQLFQFLLILASIWHAGWMGGILYKEVGF